MTVSSLNREHRFRESFKKLDDWVGKRVFSIESFSAYIEPVLQSFMPMWRSNQTLAKVINIHNESEDVYTLRLKPRKHWGGFIPGQFVGLTVNIDGALITRYFSLSSSETLWQRDGLIELTIRKQEGGFVTPWLPKGLRIGAEISLTGAAGEFVLSDKDNACLFIAGGSGITPFRSMIRSLCDAGADADIHLLYYCDGDTHLFKDEWQKLSTLNPGIKVTLIDALDGGRFCAEHLAMVPDFLYRQIYVCGPSPMIRAVYRDLQAAEVNPDQIHYEFFGAGAIEEAPEDVKGRALFDKSGVIAEPKDGAAGTLLEMAESAGLRPVTGCRMGVCHQCSCQKQSGKVYNQLTGKTSDTGAEKIQLCVSVPVTDVVLDL